MKGFFKDNLGLKLTALLLAILFELYFYSPGNLVVRTLTAQVEVTNLPPSMMIVAPSVGGRGLTVEVTVRGPSFHIEQLERETQRFVLSLPKPTPRRIAKHFDAAELLLPSGVHILGIKPDKMDFEIERVVRKELMVVVDKVGKPAEGFRIQKINVSPKGTVFARGAQSELEGVSDVLTQRIDLKGIRKSRKMEVPLLEIGPLTRLGVDVVNLEVKVVAIEKERSFSNVSINVKAADGFAAVVQPSALEKLVITGPTSIIDKVKKTEIAVTVDAKSLDAGEHKVKYKVALPKGASLRSANPKKVGLRLVASDE